jgi:hypothetical protein
MLKRVLISLLLFSLLGTSGSFFANVEQAYESYNTIINIENASYTLIVVEGVIDEQPRVGIYFSPVRAGSYSLYIVKGKQRYKIKGETKRGDIIAPIVDLKTQTAYEIAIFDHNGLYQTLAVPTNFVVELQETYDFTGLGEGYDVAKLQADVSYGKLIFYIVLAIVALGAIMIIVRFKIAKKGAFSSPKYKPNQVVDSYEQPTTNEFIDDRTYGTHEETVLEEQAQIASFDVEGYLFTQGFGSDFKTLSENDKTKVMLELMRLKASGKIDQNTYNRYTTKLWM